MGRPALVEQTRLLSIVRHRGSTLIASAALQATMPMVQLLPAAAQPATNAHPAGGSVVEGSASISESANTTTINQASQRAAVELAEFQRRQRADCYIRPAVFERRGFKPRHWSGPLADRWTR